MLDVTKNGYIQHHPWLTATHWHIQFMHSCKRHNLITQLESCPPSQVPIPWADKIQIKSAPGKIGYKHLFFSLNLLVPSHVYSNSELIAMLLFFLSCMSQVKQSIEDFNTLQRERQRQRETEREKREKREKRQTDRQTDRQRQRKRGIQVRKTKCINPHTTVQLITSLVHLQLLRQRLPL